MKKSSVRIGTAAGSGMLIFFLILSLIKGWFPSPAGGTDAFSQPEAPLSGDILKIQYIDVGQADSTLITLPTGEHFLIDAGGNGTAAALSDFLKKEGVKKLDILIGTHPHEDHIGGLDRIIKDFKIGALYMPRVADDQLPTGKTYQDVLEAASEKKLKIKTGKAGTTLYENGSIKLTALAPSSSRYDNLNNYSIVVRLEYGEKSFLFMGDAQSGSEAEILKKFDVQADVIKCGHHGASTSSSKAFIKAAAPSYAIISCGKDNSYGHPHKETLSLFSEQKVKVYRTDKQGTITVKCNGKSLRFSTSA